MAALADDGLCDVLVSGGSGPSATDSAGAAARVEWVGGEAAWQGLAQRADLLASRGRYAEALQLVDEALRLEPRRSALHYGRGQCLGHLGRVSEALASFEDVLVLEPANFDAMRGKAAALVKLQRWAEAAGCLREALDLSAVAAAPAARLGVAGAGTAPEPASGVVAEVRAELARCLTEHGVQLKGAGQGGAHLFEEAVKIFEAHAPAHFQLGVEASESGDAAKAKQAYTRAVRLHPGYVEAWNNLGVACRTLGEQEHALEAYGMALKVNQNCQKTRENMAICLLELGCKALHTKDLKKASAFLKQALVYNSKNADVYFNLGVMYAERQKFDRAKVQYELALQFEPAHTNAHNNIGVIHRRHGNLDAAARSFEEALKTDHKMVLASKNLGALFGTMGRMSEAIALTRAALEASPQDAEAYNNLALLYRDQCDVEACLEHLSACIKLDPDNVHAPSNRLMSLNYPSEKSPEEVFEAHRQWGEGIEAKIPTDFAAYKTPSVGGSMGSRVGVAPPLRVGYISPDFYTHSVSYFIHAALRYHDPAFVHITCYSDVAVEDEKTQLFKSFVPCWRNIAGMSDEEVAKMIHTDGIEVLVELTGHTGNNRLAMLARRPAPVIVTWIGYPHTTGLTRVDYRISDEHADPPAAPGLTTETLVYLPNCFLCYTPPAQAPAVSVRPAQETYGSITFGCFNNLAKVSNKTIRLWSRLLREMPDARLFLKSKALLCPEVQDKFRRAFVACGVGAGRVDLSGLQPQTGSHLQMYNLVDVALDTAPYAGTTTTCEALYMGVPVVTLAGHRVHAQNVGASLLHAVQLQDLVAASEDEFVQKASALARHTTRLAALRAGLRARMERSVLCDGPRHAARMDRLLAGLSKRLGAAGGSCGIEAAELAGEAGVEASPVAEVQ